MIFIAPEIGNRVRHPETDTDGTVIQWRDSRYFKVLWDDGMTTLECLGAQDSGLEHVTGFCTDIWDIVLTQA